jgi:hypothetical protein
LILIDEYNEFFRPTEYDSYKYVNNHKGKIPPYTLSTVRLLMSLDGHLSYNIFKVFALSQSRYQKHKVNPADLNLSYNFSYCIPNLKLNDVRNAVNFYNYIGLTYKTMDEKDILYLYTMSQGNWKELLYNCKFPFELYPTHKAYIERKLLQGTIRKTNLEIKKFLINKAKEKNQKTFGKFKSNIRDFYSQFDEYI